MQNEKFEFIKSETEFSNSHCDLDIVTIEFPNCFRQCYYKVVINDADLHAKPCFYFNRRSLANLFVKNYKSRHTLRFWVKLYQLNSQFHFDYVIKLLHDSALSKIKIDAPKPTPNKLKFEKFLEFISDKIQDVQIKCDDNGNYYFAFIPDEK